MRSVTGRLSKRSATSVPRPRGTRTTTFRPGGVTPRTYCGLRARSAGTLVPAGRAPPSRPGASGTGLASDTGVVRRRRQIHAPETLPQAREVVRGRFRRPERVAALVHPGIDGEAIEARRARHELPHPDRFRPTHRGVREAAFDQAKVEEVFRKPLGAESLADHPLVAAEPRQPDLEPIARVHLKELEILEHAPV